MRSATESGEPIKTADVLVIPAGRRLPLARERRRRRSENDPTATDYMVIHSFWMPRLFGKQDVVPGRTNHIMFTADEPGMYTGQCAEFCGLQHGRMKFGSWPLGRATGTPGSRTRSARPPPTDPLAAQGMDLFLNPLSDGRGRASRATPSAARTAAEPGGAEPDALRRSRPTRVSPGATGTPSDREALEAWLRDPNAVKLGAKMPDYQLTE